MRRRHVSLGLAAIVGAALAGSAAAAAPPTLAAAADLRFAVEEIAQGFTAETGREIRLVFGSSGNLMAQIQQGAPFELFMSADEELVLELAEAGLTEDRGQLYAIGRIALLVPTGSPLAPDGTLEDLQAAVADGRLTRFAIANPEHAPYGRRAAEALRHVGLWEAIAPKLVFGENVAQAAQFAVSGSAQGGIVAYSLALAPAVASLAAHALIPEAWHEPLRQRMVLLEGASDTSRSFYAHLQRPAARAIMRRYGFVLPGEPAS